MKANTTVFTGENNLPELVQDKTGNVKTLQPTARKLVETPEKIVKM